MVLAEVVGVFARGHHLTRVGVDAAAVVACNVVAELGDVVAQRGILVVGDVDVAKLCIDAAAAAVGLVAFKGCATIIIVVAADGAASHVDHAVVVVEAAAVLPGVVALHLYLGEVDAAVLQIDAAARAVGDGFVACGGGAFSVGLVAYQVHVEEADLFGCGVASVAHAEDTAARAFVAAIACGVARNRDFFRGGLAAHVDASSVGVEAAAVASGRVVVEFARGGFAAHGEVGALGGVGSIPVVDVDVA